MSDIFVSYARSTAAQAQAVAVALRALGYGVWLDDELPAHRAYAEVIEERLKAAKAVVVVWSAEAVKSEWVQSEADRAREDRKLVQLSLDGAKLPMPFDRIQCADMNGWNGDLTTPGWRKVVASIADLMGVEAEPIQAPPALPVPSKPSIAVLPFVNRSGDPEQDYFADGMVEEIVSALSRFKSIFVIGAGSSLSLKSRGLSPQDAARLLGVRYVLQGSVRNAGGRVRIAVELIDASDAAQIWSGRFEDTLDDVFALQDKVALSAAGAIEPTVQQAEVRRANARPTENMGAYDLYLRALGLFRVYGRASVTAAAAPAHRAIELDPEFGAALSLAASIHYTINVFGWSNDPQSDSRQAIELTRRALKAAGDDADVLATAAGPTIQIEGDLDAASVLVERAIALNPGNARAWMYSGIVSLQRGDLDLAAEHLQAAMRLDPMGPSRVVRNSIMAAVLYHQESYAEAAVYARDATREADHPPAYIYLAACLGRLGQVDAARVALARYAAISPQSIEAFIGTSAITTTAPARARRLRDGIALAEGKSPAADEGAAL